MQKFLKSILSFCIAVALCLGITATANIAVTEYIVADAATDYYAGITAKSGKALLGQLHDLIVTTHTTYTSYAECKTYGPVTDPAPNGVGVMDFYTHTSVAEFSGTVGTWNREHVWCQYLSKDASTGTQLWGTSGAGSDMHHIRPTESKINNNRGNNKYGVVSSHSSSNEEYAYNTSGATVALGGYSYGNTFEPLDNVKGDVARIVMYVYTHYNNASIVGGTKEAAKTRGNLPFTNVITASSESAAISMLLEWNALDPVDEIETYRNEEVYKVQGNRNPFIDNSDYANAIWGDGTTPIDPTPSDTLKSISLNATALNLNVGNSYNLTVTPNPSNASASVTWTSSNTAVATVSNGTVTAKTAGMATITATSTVNNSIKATATVTVKQASSSETTNGKVTITRGSFINASSGYGLYSWTSDGIEGTAYIYGSNSDSMQFNTKQNSRFLASATTKGTIKKVTIDASGNSSWTLLTSTQPYSGITSGNPQNGNTHDEDVLDSGTWTVSGNDTYFALVLGGNGAAYINSIEVEYESGGSSETPDELQSIAINPSAFTLKEGDSTKLSIVSIPSTITAEVNWTSSNTSVATVSADGTVTAVGAGNATITATSKSNSAIKASATVTVNAETVTPPADSEKLKTFHDAVAAIESDGTLAAQLASINSAINAYKAMSDADKVAAADDVEALRSAITSYNETIRAYNNAANSADVNALKGLGR